MAVIGRCSSITGNGSGGDGGGGSNTYIIAHFWRSHYCYKGRQGAALYTIDQRIKSTLVVSHRYNVK